VKEICPGKESVMDLSLTNSHLVRLEVRFTGQIAVAVAERSEDTGTADQREDGDEQPAMTSST
jgi:hypothetical protein